jgi:hypothetical protein
MFDPNEDVIKLDCGHYDQESKAYHFGEKSLICGKCFTRHEVAEQQEVNNPYPVGYCYEEDYQMINRSKREQAARAILNPFLLGLRLCGMGSKK